MEYAMPKLLPKIKVFKGETVPPLLCSSTTFEKCELKERVLYAQQLAQESLGLSSAGKKYIAPVGRGRRETLPTEGINLLEEFIRLDTTKQFATFFAKYGFLIDSDEVQELEPIEKDLRILQTLYRLALAVQQAQEDDTQNFKALVQVRNTEQLKDGMVWYEGYNTRPPDIAELKKKRRYFFMLNGCLTYTFSSELPTIKDAFQIIATVVHAQVGESHSFTLLNDEGKIVPAIRCRGLRTVLYLQALRLLGGGQQRHCVKCGNLFIPVSQQRPGKVKYCPRCASPKQANSSYASESRKRYSEAVEAIKNGLPIEEALKKYKVQRANLFNHLAKEGISYGEQNSEAGKE